MKDRLIKELDSADLYLRDRANSAPAPLNEYDIEAMLDIAKTCDEAASVLLNAIFLPCKIGDKVWAICNRGGVKRPQESIVSDMYFTKNMEIVIVARYVARGLWGKTVFLTKEEAEIALKGGAE